MNQLLLPKKAKRHGIQKHYKSLRLTFASFESLQGSVLRCVFCLYFGRRILHLPSLTVIYRCTSLPTFPMNFWGFGKTTVDSRNVFGGVLYEGKESLEANANNVEKG